MERESQQAFLALQRILEQEYESQADLIVDLKDFFSYRWAIIKKTDSSYLSFPLFPINQACIKIAEEMVSDDEPIISILMPTLVNKPYEILGVSLRELTEEDKTPRRLKNLRNFLLSVSEDRLISIRDCFYYSAENIQGTFQHLYSNNAASVVLSKSEVNWLRVSTADSSISGIYADLIEHKAKSINTIGTLAYELIKLKNGLLKGSVRGSGTEYIAGPEALTAISNFVQIWVKLGVADREIAASLSVQNGRPLESYLLRLFAGTPGCELTKAQLDRVNEENVFSCVHIIANILESLINSNANVLINIETSKVSIGKNTATTANCDLVLADALELPMQKHVYGPNPYAPDTDGNKKFFITTSNFYPFYEPYYALLKIYNKDIARSIALLKFEKLFLSPNGITALKENFFDVQQIKKMDQNILTLLLSDKGIIALRERLLTAEQVLQLGLSDKFSYKFYNCLQTLLSENGLISLREKLITLEKIFLLDHRTHLPHVYYKLVNTGVNLLRENLLTVEQIEKLSIQTLLLFLSENGIIALRERLIDIEKIIQLELDVTTNRNNTQYVFEHLLSDYGLIALREKLITPEQACNLNASAKQVDSYTSFLKLILSSNGLIVLRDKLLSPEQAANVRLLKELLSEDGVKLLKERLLTAEHVQTLSQQSLSILLTENAYIALSEKLITPELIEKIAATNHRLLSKLFSTNGLIALRENLITAEKAYEIEQVADKERCYSWLDYLLRYEGLIALREHLIIFDKNMPLKVLEDILSERGFGLLKEKLLTVEQANKMDSRTLKMLVTKDGCIALREKLITPEEANEIMRMDYEKRYGEHKDLQILFSKNGLIALREKLITAKQAAKVKNLNDLLSDNGLKLLTQKKLTADQAMEMDSSTIGYLCDKYGSIALNEGLITADQACQIAIVDSETKERRLNYLLSENGITALREKYITYEEVLKISSLLCVLTNRGLNLLRKNLFTAKLASEIDSSSLESLLSKEGCDALQEGLIRAEQIYHLVHRHEDSIKTNSLDYILRNILSENGLSALREKLIQVEQCANIKCLGLLLSDTGLSLLRENVISIEEIKELDRETFELLLQGHGPIALREKIITIEQAVKMTNYDRDDGMQMYSSLNLRILLTTTTGLIALRKKFISPEQAAKINNLATLLTDLGLEALGEKLITPEQVKEFTREQGENLKSLLSQNGLIALREKLITPEQAASTNKLYALLSDFGLQALRENLISPEHAKLISHNSKDHAMSDFLNQNGLAALREKLITMEQIVEMYCLANRERNYSAVSLLFTPNGLTALREKLIIPHHAARIPGLDSLLSDQGLQLLRERIITSEQVVVIVHGKSRFDSEKRTRVDAFLSENGIFALRNKLLSPQEASNIEILDDLFRSKFGIEALEAKLITPIQAAKFIHGARSVKALLSEAGLTALREKLITPEQAAEFYHSGMVGSNHDHLDLLLKPVGLQLLRVGLLTPEQSVITGNLRDLLNIKSELLISGLKNEIIYIEDFQYKGQFVNRDTKDIENYIQEQLTAISNGTYTPRVMQKAQQGLPQAELSNSSTTSYPHLERTKSSENSNDMTWESVGNLQTDSNHKLLKIGLSSEKGVTEITNNAAVYLAYNELRQAANRLLKESQNFPEKTTSEYDVLLFIPDLNDWMLRLHVRNDIAEAFKTDPTAQSLLADFKNVVLREYQNNDNFAPIYSVSPEESESHTSVTAGIYTQYIVQRLQRRENKNLQVMPDLREISGQSEVDLSRKAASNVN
jgi:hypothetical protein